jgi:thiol-disulfide isomerase/thioredoxin
MSKYSAIGWVGALAIAWAGSTVRAQTLGAGDPAPKLQVKSFIKGEPVKELEAGKNYVVEFWATWCGPCRATIPHLTQLQKKHPDVTFIGVSVYENDQSQVEPFVKEMGDKMVYRVALDSVPAGKGRGDGAMAKSWMEAAGQNGIPTAFIVDKEGKIAWIGHPTDLDRPLDQVIAGTFDPKKEKEEKAKFEKLERKLQSAQRSGDAKDILAATDEIATLRPDYELRLGVVRLPALLKLDQQDKALELARKLEKSELGEDPQGLNTLAWTIVDPDSGTKPKPELVKLALEMATKADEKTDRKNGAIADTLAKTYFDTGDAAKALETQERAVRLMKESGEAIDPGVQERLEKYKKAVAKK